MKSAVRKSTALEPVARRLALLMIGFLAAFVIAGCGGDSEGAAQAASSESKITAGAASAAMPTATRSALVRTEPPARETVVDRARLPADLLPHRRAVLAAETQGVLDSQPVEEGQWVNRGAVIARLDTRALDQAVAEAEALDRQAEAQFKRAQALFERRSITQKDLLDAITNRDVARARLASARLQLEKSVVTAPWAGRVAEKRVEVGDYLTPGQPVVELLDVSRIKVRAPAAASDVPYLAVGAPAVVRVAALPERTFEGRVARLGTELDASARTLAVEVELANPDGLLKPGMLATLEIPRRTLEDALLVPLEAVVDLAEQRVVYVVEDGVARRRVVELGPVVGDRVVVAAGLAAEDAVVVEGTQSVAEGQAVREAAQEDVQGSPAAREAS